MAYWDFKECPNKVVCSGSNLFVDGSGNGNSCTPSGSPLGRSALYSQLTGGTLYGATIY